MYWIQELYSYLKNRGFDTYINIFSDKAYTQITDIAKKTLFHSIQRIRVIPGNLYDFFKIFIIDIIILILKLLIKLN